MSDTRKVSIRDVPSQLWIQFRSEAIQRGVTITQAVSEAIRLWLDNDNS